MELYYQPHRSRKKEATFVTALIDALQPDHVVEEHFPLPEQLLQKNLLVEEIVNWLGSSELSERKMQRAMQELLKLPAEVKIANNDTKITCDVVVVKDEVPHYYEYNERQHLTLSVNRPATLYTLDDMPLTVPRFVQRFLRDIWRTTYLRPYTVVWDDYFALHDIGDIAELKTGYREYFLPDKFNFLHFAKQRDFG